MSFANKKDYFGLADVTYFKISDSSEGKSSQLVTALGDNGDIVGQEVYGVNYSPSCSYKLTKCLGTTSGTMKNIVLGGLTTSTAYDSTSIQVALASVSISTGAGSEPSISANGEMCYKGTGTYQECCKPCTYTVTIGGLSPKRHAQILEINGSAPFTYSNGNLIQANYEISSSLAKSTVNGDPVAADVTEGKVTVTVTFVGTVTSGQGEATVPSITANGTDNWEITSPLTITNNDASFPQWTATLTLNLGKDTPTQSNNQ